MRIRRRVYPDGAERPPIAAADLEWLARYFENRGWRGETWTREAIARDLREMAAEASS